MSTMGTLLKIPGMRELPRNAPKTERSISDMMVITAATLPTLKKPPSQRPLNKQASKVEMVAKELQLQAAENDGVCIIPDPVTLARLVSDPPNSYYLLDGQHRLHGAFEMACGPEILVEGGALATEAWVDVRICTYETMADMGDAFARINSNLVKMKAEDILRANEASNEHLKAIRKACPFIGYDGIRIAKGDTQTAKLTLSMSIAIKTWLGSGGATPTNGPSSTEAVKALTKSNVEAMIDFFQACWRAWEGDKCNFKMWGTLNLGMLMWLWRKLVLGEIGPLRHGGRLAMTLTKQQFILCMRALAANSDYTDWLRNRSLSDRDRPPCYGKIKAIFTRRMAEEDIGIDSPRFPQSNWVTT